MPFVLKPGAASKVSGPRTSARGRIGEREVGSNVGAIFGIGEIVACTFGDGETALTGERWAVRGVGDFRCDGVFPWVR